MSRQSSRSGSMSDLDIGGEPHQRTSLLESEAEELRNRIDTLLSELRRERRPDVAELVRRYALPAGAAIVVGTTGIFALVRWRRRRHIALGARLGMLAGARFQKLLASLG
jgi:hypothetical protein